MSETKTPGRQLCLQQLHETIRPVAVPFFKLCSETAGMFVPYISVRGASTFVAVELSQQVYLLHLPQTRSHVSYDCT